MNINEIIKKLLIDYEVKKEELQIISDEIVKSLNEVK